MENQTLPTKDLKKYGIIQPDNTFTKKLSAEDILGFMMGKLLVADNDRDRITFRLTDRNSRLEVKLYQLERSLESIREKAVKSTQYANEKDLNLPEGHKSEISRKAFVVNEKSRQLSEYDLLADAELLTKAILEKNNPDETDRYRQELLKMREYLQEKIDRYPEIAKEITANLNIVSKEIDTVNSVIHATKQSAKQQQSTVRLDVNDPDLYQDANAAREEEEMTEEQEKRRGFRR